MRIGEGSTEKEIKDQEANGFVSIGRFSDIGEYIHRAISGPRKRETVIYPTFYEDWETNEIKETFNSITLVPNARTVLDKIAAIDRKIQKSNGADKEEIRTQFNRSLRYMWIVLSRTEETEEGVPWIGPWEYPSRVSKQLTEAHKAIDSKDKTKLRYGLYFTFDHIVNKYYDKETMRKTSGNKQFSTRYSFEVDPSNIPMAGKLPADLLNRDYREKHAKKIMDLYGQVFTPIELDAIEESEWALEDLVTPVKTDEEIMEILTERPINWNAVDLNGNDIFKNKEQLFDECQEFASRLLGAGASVPRLEKTNEEPAKGVPEKEEWTTDTTPTEEFESTSKVTEEVTKEAPKEVKETTEDGVVTW